MTKDTNLDLINLGLSSDETELYTLIVTNGLNTGSEIRNELNWGASKVDAVIYQLIHKELITSVTENGKVLYRPTSFENLHKTLELKKTKVQLIEQQLSNITFTSESKSNHFKDSKIIQYHGINGLKQVLWNTTKAEQIIQGYEYIDNAEYMDFSIMDDIRQELVKRKIRTQSIMNLTAYGAFTNVADYLKLYECRYIDPKDIEIHHEIMIYNDVYTIFRADKNGIFCTEIYNQRLVDLQKQLFKYIWNRAQKLKLSPSGELDLA